ncbi:MAG TPA: BTAD domain-containing putative transcriptional regulator [Gaiellaceae bacterium]|nr:BTAD domain-containing putative transcriptional regulator [Gaiellaceae bacterium]
MQVRVLGPLEVSDDGRVVELGAGRQRALLALLALHAPEIVATDRLIEKLWGGSPPPTAAKALQNLVSQLRRSLGADSIATRAPGYSLRLEAEDLDARRFERLAAEGHRLLEEDPGRAGRTLVEALGLWRGRALADFAYEDFAQSEITRLNELRLGAIEDRIDADLAMGRATELIPELEPLVSAHPLRERLRGQLMLALYRSGRQADALEAYRAGRRLLDEELGLEPDDELQRLEKAILNHDPSLESPITAGAERPSRAPRRRASCTNAPPPDSVAVIDQQRSRVVGHVLVGRRPVALAIGHGSVWVANTDDGTVSRIDPDRREVIRTIGIGAPTIDLAVGTDAVWVANGSDGTVSRIDPSVDVVVETIDLRGSSELVWNPTYAVVAGDDSVWIAAGPRHVLRIDPTTNESSANIDVGHVPVGLALGNEALWVVTTAERALRIEPHTNTATAEVPIEYPIALTAGTQAVWVSDSHGQVWRINPDTGTVTQTTSVGGGLVGLCATDGAVFAANNADGTVVQIDPQDGRVVGLIAVGHAPTDVASWDGTVWVSIQSESAIGLLGG